MCSVLKYIKKVKNFTIICGSLLVVLSSASAQIRIMPLGGKIVLGTGSSTNNVGGFRDDLHLMLNSNGMPVDFVGSMNDSLSLDPHHEGHVGTTIDVINQNLSNYLQQYQPHIVLINLGAED